MSPHGTHSRYTNDGCHCEECRAAHAVAIARRRTERRAEVATYGFPATVKHGASAYKNWGCKCSVCRGAWAAYMRSYEERRRTARTTPT